MQQAELQVRNAYVSICQAAAYVLHTSGWRHATSTDTSQKRTAKGASDSAAPDVIQLAFSLVSHGDLP
jgi:hypothetical protein